MCMLFVSAIVCVLIVSSENSKLYRLLASHRIVATFALLLFFQYADALDNDK